ncbi:MAG TPA: TonB-dependent receptor [Steroidobacteraceae bacterium]|jgi:iron complex outermembrane receptor protein|nr:TonB-dependent receptor [Steroidobacteraceae bacterium]
MNNSSRLAQAVRRALLLGAVSSAGARPGVAADQTVTAPQGELQEIVITGQQFNYGELQSANKMPMSVVDTPQTVQIITSDMINFANLTNFNDMYKLDAGAQPSYSRAGITHTYFRGFANDFEDALRVDGFRQLGSVVQDLAPYDRVEIIKGSVATTYGQSGTAGTINAVTKQPQPNFGGSASVEAGQWNHYRADFDIYGPLTEDRQLTGRMVAAYLDEDSSFQYWYTKHIVLAPSLKYAFPDDTSVLLQVQYQHLDSSASVGFPAALDAGGSGGANNPANYSLPAVPYDSFGVGAPWSQMKKNFYDATVRVEHKFDSSWQLRSNFQYTHLRSDPLEWVWPGAFNTLPANKNSVTNIYTYFGEEDNSSYSGEVDLFGDVDLFGHKQTLFLGADTERLHEAFEPYAAGLLPGSTTGFNIYNPNWALIPQSATGSYSAFAPGGIYGPNGGTVKDYKRLHDNTGVTAQAILRPFDPLTVNLGLRWSRSTEIASTRCCSYAAHLEPYPAYTDYYPPQDATTFQGGVVYALTKSVNAYATWGQTFDVRDDFAFDSANPTGNGKFLGPDKGVTYEAGLKGELNSKRVYWAADVFNTARTNVDQPDPLHPQFMIQVGQQRARGAELEFQGNVRPGLDVYLSATAMTNEYTAGPYAGIVSPFGPKFGVSAYGSYQIQGGDLRGLGFGGGVVHQHRPKFQLLDGMVFPQFFGDFTTVDLRTFYDTEHWRFELSASNAFNDRFFSPTYVWLGGQLAVNPPRQILGKLTRRF